MYFLCPTFYWFSLEIFLVYLLPLGLTLAQSEQAVLVCIHSKEWAQVRNCSAMFVFTSGECSLLTGPMISLWFHVCLSVCLSHPTVHLQLCQIYFITMVTVASFPCRLVSSSRAIEGDAQWSMTSSGTSNALPLPKSMKGRAVVNAGQWERCLHQTVRGQGTSTCTCSHY